MNHTQDDVSLINMNHAMLYSSIPSISSQLPAMTYLSIGRVSPRLVWEVALAVVLHLW